VKDNFEFYAEAKLPSGKYSERVLVQVKGTAIGVLSRGGKLLAVGVWDAGKYVRYPRAYEVPLPPQLLDDIDRELRKRMTRKGEQLRVDPPRRSAVGYSNR
jgi:hypothetical protein